MLIGEIMKKSYLDTYLNILLEEEQTKEADDSIENSEETPDQEQSDSTDLDNTDELAETNQDFEDDGWGEQIEEDLTPILNKLDDFSYEIKNCVRGAMTNAKTKDELADYIDSLAEELSSYAETLRG